MYISLAVCIGIIAFLSAIICRFRRHRANDGRRQSTSTNVQASSRRSAFQPMTKTSNGPGHATWRMTDYDSPVARVATGGGCSSCEEDNNVQLTSFNRIDSLPRRAMPTSAVAFDAPDTRRAMPTSAAAFDAPDTRRAMPTSAAAFDAPDTAAIVHGTTSVSNDNSSNHVDRNNSRLSTATVGMPSTATINKSFASHYLAATTSDSSRQPSQQTIDSFVRTPINGGYTLPGDKLFSACRWRQSSGELPVEFSASRRTTLATSYLGCRPFQAAIAEGEACSAVGGACTAVGGASNAAGGACSEKEYFFRGRDYSACGWEYRQMESMDRRRTLEPLTKLHNFPSAF